jgi:hypothetical protein
MILEIQYRDKVNWESISGKQIDWTNYSKKYKDERVQPYYVAPVPTTDIWNGKESDIQHISWTSYFFEMFIKESEIEFARQLKSCSDINIIQYADDSGTIINKSYENIDLIKADFLEISEPERASDTSGWKVQVIFRTERTVINKAIETFRNNKINFQNNEWTSDFGSTLNGYTDFFNNTSIAVSSGPTLAKYNIKNESWVQEGNTLSGLSIQNDLTTLSANRVCVLNNLQTLETYDFDGTDWAQVGNSFNTTFSLSRLCSLSSTRVAVYSATGTNIIAYDFDGTDWAQVGNALVIAAGAADVARMTSGKIALIDPTSGDLRSYDFDGTNWTLDQTISTTVSGSVGVAELESDRVAIVSSTEGILKSYKLNGSWVLESGGLSVSASGIISGLDINSVISISGANTANYNYGNIYYTDFDVLVWNKPTEDVEVEWFDGSKKKAQRINKDGLEYVQYLPTSEHDEFIEDLKSTNDITINGISVNEVDYEATIIAEGLYKIIVRGVSSINNLTDYLDTNQDYNIVVNGNTYYTDYKTELISGSAEIKTSNNQDGLNKASKAISKTVKQMKFYKNETDAFALKQDFELFGQSAVINPGAENVEESREVTPERLGDDLYEIIVNCLTAATIE